MDKKLISKEHELEEVKVEDEIASHRASIAEKKALEKEMKKKYGPGWRKILGLGKMGSVSDFYAVDPSLRELSIPRMGRLR